MAYLRFSFLSILLFMGMLHAQSLTAPEPQISFAKEVRSNEYYVKQAELWWAEVQKDKKSEDAWFNYWRACRNAHGSANWRNDFLNASPDLRFGRDIVGLIEKNIPNTFTHYFLKGSDAGVSPENGEYLKKAYKMNPDFQGINGDMITYASSTHNPELRKEVNQYWFKKNEWSPGFMSYSYNVLASIAPNAILLTQGDNDTYPVWMLQDARGIRPDVKVINIDFLVLEQFRKPVFEELGIPSFTIENIDINEYEENWANIVKHVLVKYKGERPLYLAMTIDPRWYEGFEDRLSPVGLAWKAGKKQEDLTEASAKLFEEAFLLDHLKAQLTYDVREERLAQLNVNYLKSFKAVYGFYKKKGQVRKAEEVMVLAKRIIDSIKDKKRREKMLAWFEG